MFIVSTVLAAVKHTFLASRRPVLYTIVTWFHVAGVFPLAIAAYLYFYLVLIPTSPQEIIPINEVHTVPYLPQVKHEVYYDVLLRLKLWCFDSAQYLAHYSLVSQSDSTSYFPTSVLINCDWKNVYKYNNPYVPYALRWLVFPKWINWDKTYGVDVSIAYDVEGSFLKQTPLNLVIDEAVRESYSPTSQLVLDVAWRGMRYYMYHYYFTSLVIGSAVFYGMCTSVMLLSSLLMNASAGGDTKKRR